MLVNASLPNAIFWLLFVIECSHPDISAMLKQRNKGDDKASKGGSPNNECREILKHLGEVRKGESAYFSREFRNDSWSLICEFKIECKCKRAFEGQSQ